jgi:cytoskeletal protein CcmA (bactofilin family)
MGSQLEAAKCSDTRGIAGMKVMKSKQDVTLIAADSEIEGSLRFSSQLFVKGKVTGNISAEEPGATLIISPDGFVVGDIRVPNVVINGHLDGNVYADERLEVSAGAEVQGDLYYSVIEMHMGAQVQGRLIHSENDADKKGTVHALPVDSGRS